jgi:hypothetical protein
MSKILHCYRRIFVNVKFYDNMQNQIPLQRHALSDTYIGVSGKLNFSFMGAFLFINVLKCHVVCEIPQLCSSG